ncbi:MAG: metal ABC transporter permease [Peptostreptococcus sp.]|uniref:metal ABC transporter permease n=1 Tax=Peptostreptococcus sp. TaxID=1262 RepID=UPI002FC9043C
MLEYEFMRRAFVVGLLLATIIPCIGVTIVLKRLSMMGDALSHASLAGVAAGLVIGINPILGAVIVTVIAGFGINVIRKRFPKYAEISIAIVMSAGVGLAGVLSGFTDNSSVFTSFLFGSIVAITDFELYLVVALAIVVMLAFLLLYKELMYISFDEEGARLAGIPVKSVDFIFTILTALTVAIASRTVGALIVSSIMVIPVACAMRFTKSYKMTVILSVLFALAFTVVGLVLSFYLGLKPGGTIVLAGVITLIVAMIVKK